ncbi:MAG TPA: hypothetical protein VK034_05395 [Enhygromyxa sp.]|nr:hypothetical protein [Enhygromyxa sp.]
MDEYIRSLLDESARQGRCPLDQQPAAERRPLGPREIVDRLALSAGARQREFVEALIAAVPPSAAASSTLPEPPASIQQGGFRNYPTPYEPTFGCVDAEPPCDTRYIGVPGHFGALPYLRGVRGTGRRMIIALHGSDLPGWRRHPAWAIYNYAANAANDIWGDDYVIIAPIFQKTDYKPYSMLMPWIWYWSPNRPYGHGNRADRFDPCHYLIEAAGLSIAELADCTRVDRREIAARLAIGGYTGRPSSFQVLDALIRHEVAMHTPELEYVCIVGHSHGGQAVQRYALLDRGITDHVRQATGKPLRYVAMNAGSYAYLIEQRWITPPARSVGCAPPTDDPRTAFWTYPTACDGYDDWPQGLGASEAAEARGVPLEQARQHAIARYPLGPVSLRTALAHNFANQDVHILQSVLDDDLIGPGGACPSFQQGCSRLQRMRLFRESLYLVLPDQLHEKMRIIAGNCRAIDATRRHSGFSMFRNPTVRSVIFGPG